MTASARPSAQRPTSSWARGTIIKAMQRRRRNQSPVWGERSRRSPLPLIGLALVALAGVVGLGAGIAALLRAGLNGGSPLLTAICLGGVILASLGLAIVLLRAGVRRLVEGQAERRMATIGGLAVLMGLAPLLIILVVILLARWR